VINGILLLLSSLLFAAQLWGYYLHFRVVGAPTWRLRLMAATFLAAYAAQVWALWPGTLLPWSAWPGVAIYAAGLGLWAWAARTSGRGRLSLAFSRDMPRTVISDGPYRYVRHPFYAAYILHCLGGAVATLDWVVCLASLPAAAMCWVAAEREERRFAASDLAGVYREYQARTGMFLPSLRRDHFK
jgi:protein-S-isoprenylcysteine O-methyltransferase Ste14